MGKRKRKNLVLDEDILKCAEKRMDETHRKSLNNYVEHLILQDCKRPNEYVIKDIVDGETIYEVKSGIPSKSKFMQKLNDAIAASEKLRNERKP